MYSGFPPTRCTADTRFLRSVGVFLHSVDSFVVWILLGLMSSHLSIFCVFVSCALGSYLKTHCPFQHLEAFPLFLFLPSFSRSYI